MKKTLLAIALAVATPLMFAAPQATNAPASNPPAKTAKKHKHVKRAPKKGAKTATVKK